jgi:outer membrane protein assembly factor BamC
MMLNRSLLSLPTVAVIVATAGLAGCSWLKPAAGPDYRTQGQTTKIRSLEVPPDLTKPFNDERFIVPDGKATTFSQYSRDRGNQPVATGGTAVLPKFENASMVRAGDQRWLVVKVAPDRIWPVLKEFWTENGFVLKRETPESGIMETDWAENRSKIQQDIIRNSVGRLLDGLYSTGERDKFRTRIEAGAEPGTTEIYVSHRGIEEVFTNPDKNSTGWQFRPIDKDLEAEMLGRMMVKFGFATDKTAAVASATSAPANLARATYDAAKSSVLKVTEPFDRAWRRVGLALDRSGFTVEDRDRSKGTFFVRYIDPDVEIQSGEKKGFFDKLAFWRSDKPQDRPQYRIKVTDAGAATDVEVQTAEGKPDTSATAKRITALLFEQLR